MQLCSPAGKAEARVACKTWLDTFSEAPRKRLYTQRPPSDASILEAPRHGPRPTRATLVLPPPAGTCQQQVDTWLAALMRHTSITQLTLAYARQDSRFRKPEDFSPTICVMDLAPLTHLRSLVLDDSLSQQWAQQAIAALVQATTLTHLTVELGCSQANADVLSRSLSGMPHLEALEIGLSHDWQRFTDAAAKIETMLKTLAATCSALRVLVFRGAPDPVRCIAAARVAFGVAIDRMDVTFASHDRSLGVRSLRLSPLVLNQRVTTISLALYFSQETRPVSMAENMRTVLLTAQLDPGSEIDHLHLKCDHMGWQGTELTRYTLPDLPHLRHLQLSGMAVRKLLEAVMAGGGSVTSLTSVTLQGPRSPDTALALLAVGCSALTSLTMEVLTYDPPSWESLPRLGHLTNLHVSLDLRYLSQSPFPFHIRQVPSSLVTLKLVDMALQRAAQPSEFRSLRMISLNRCEMADLHFFSQASNLLKLILIDTAVFAGHEALYGFQKLEELTIAADRNMKKGARLKRAIDSGVAMILGTRPKPLHTMPRLSRLTFGVASSMQAVTLCLSLPRLRELRLYVPCLNWMSSDSGWCELSQTKRDAILAFCSSHGSLGALTLVGKHYENDVVQALQAALPHVSAPWVYAQASDLWL